MSTSSKMLFSLTMLISTIMVISSSSWINMWMGLEINMMSFIPLITKSKNSFLSQSSMMYFLIQGMASMMFIVTILLMKNTLIFSKEMMKMMIIITMMMKMGMPPFQMWFTEIMNKMSWMMCFILMTWQKIAPMYVMSMVVEMNKMMMMLICLTAIMGAVGGINQTSTRKIMAYSSITHMSWMMACAATYKKSWMLYMMLYTIMMATITMMMSKYNIMFINQMNIFSKKKMEKMMIIFLILSLGGLPPFMGFLPKWITIQYMMSSKEFFMMMVMVMSALITLFYYMRMSSSMNLMMSSSQKWTKIMPTDMKTSSYIYYTNMLLPLIILMMNFY